MRILSQVSWAIAPLSVLLAYAACGGSGSTGGQGEGDAGADATTDVGSDAQGPGSDANTDVASDTQQPGVDATTVQDSSAPADAGMADGALDALADAQGADSSADAQGADSSGDVAADVSEDATSTPQTCGDGVISGTEQCDDGNQFNLDGCDSTCHYEVVTRMTAYALSGSPAPAALGCVPSINRLGKSFSMLYLNQVNTQWTTDIGAGTANMMAQLIGLADLTGVNSTSFSIGFFPDAALDPAKGTWPGNSPIDWWFLADHAWVDSTGKPTGLFTNATLANRNFSAGPADIEASFLGASVAMRSSHIAGTINGTPAPDVPAPPPSALAAGLTVFQTVTANGTGQGLCGNVTVQSLAAVPVPPVLAQGGSVACGGCTGSHTYTACATGQTPNTSTCNSLLDVIVGGCVTTACLVPAVTAAQPDVPAGATVTSLALGANDKVPIATTQADQDAYSSYFTFTMNRAHFTGETCAATSDCQTGKTCTAGECQ